MRTGVGLERVDVAAASGEERSHGAAGSCQPSWPRDVARSGQQKFQNISRDDRVSVVVWDHEKPDREGEVRGRVVDTLTGSDARQHIDRLSQKYAGTPYGIPIKSERVILRIEPVHQVPPQM